MGTNFHWLVPDASAITLPTGETIDLGIETDDPRIHIGKRSAAGLYCFDCRVSLCPGGEKAVHDGTYDRWPDRCPKCGQSPAPTSHDDRMNPVAIELGFAKATSEQRTGVRGAASFTWAQDPERVVATCEAHADEEIVEDEYRRRYTGRQFVDMLNAACPIRFTDSIGRWFS